MIKKIAKLVTGLFVGAVLVLGVAKSVDADVFYMEKGGKIFAYDTVTGYYVDLPAGVIIPGPYGNMVVVKKTDDDGKEKFSLKYSPYSFGLTAEQWLDMTYNTHVANFQAYYGTPWAYAYNVPECPGYLPNTMPYNMASFKAAFDNIDWSTFPVK